MITSLFLKKNEIKEYLILSIEKYFNVESEISYNKQLLPIINILSPDITFFFEYPYVEKYYRDSYYHFFSKKHKDYNRNSIRISFFNKCINDKTFLEADKEDFIQKNFYGYITIRPTTYKLIGHSFISPLALKTYDFVSCLSSEQVLISGHKLKIKGFPYISQDNESITCSESAIINLLDYFSHKYPEYQIILPSQVSRILSKHSPERQLPSKGLPTDNISYVLKKIGFGTVVYTNDSKSKKVFNKKVFREIMYAYIESGIPIIATLSTNISNHAVLVIGRKSIEQNVKLNNGFLSKKNYLTFSNAFNEVLIMDDNQPPYKLVSYDNPILINNQSKPNKLKKSFYEFKSIIVPLYSKIHLDAYLFKITFFKILKILIRNFKNEKINFIPVKSQYILRYYITSSRSYKNYISKANNLTFEFKTLIIDKAMPKFIWVGEIFKGNTIQVSQEVYSVLVLDATESGKSGHLIFASDMNYLVFDNLSIDEGPINQYHIIFFERNQNLYTFANNLKGKHTTCQN
jgi:hypothetical protein